jgi:acetyltransferase-like isoleucine patch superfamily enzyme
MDCEETIVDARAVDPTRAKEEQRVRHLLFQMSQLETDDERYAQLLKEIFRENLGEGSFIGSGLHGACISSVRIGNRVLINSNVLLMARGGITIEDDVMIAADASIITNNHDPYDRMLLPCRPVLVRQGAWIGAHAIVLPGVCVGRHSIVGAGSVVTKDVPDFGVVVGNPAHVIRMLDPERFS